MVISAMAMPCWMSGTVSWFLLWQCHIECWVPCGVSCYGSAILNVLYRVVISAMAVPYWMSGTVWWSLLWQLEVLWLISLLQKLSSSGTLMLRDVLWWPGLRSLKADSHIACLVHAVPLRVWNVFFPFDLRSAAMSDSHLPCRAHTMFWPCRGLEKNGIVRAWNECSMASVNQTRPHCVNQMGKTHSKHLAARHGRGMAWARHARCESAFTVTISDAVLIQFDLLMISTTLLETCGGL